MLGLTMCSGTRDGAGALPPRLGDLVRRLHALAHAAHERFDRQIWAALRDARVDLDGHPEAPSYHNQTHVQSVVDCVDAVWSRSHAGADPFDLEGQLERWRSREGAAVLDWTLFGAALKLAFSCHDLGNITASPRVSNGDRGDISFEFGHRYDSSALYERPEVEIRSADIAGQLLEHYLGPGELLDALRPLVRHLILQTIFRFDQTSSDKLFWYPMQVVDMVGSYFYAPQRRSQAVAGLFNEMRVQADGLGEVSVASFLPSLQKRFERLIPDPARQEQVLAMFEANPHGHGRHDVFAVPEHLAQALRPEPFVDAITLLLRE
jgi:hypothetical protein